MECAVVDGGVAEFEPVVCWRREAGVLIVRNWYGDVKVRWGGGVWVESGEVERCEVQEASGTSCCEYWTCWRE